MLKYARSKVHYEWRDTIIAFIILGTGFLIFWSQANVIDPIFRALSAMTPIRICTKSEHSTQATGKYTSLQTRKLLVSINWAVCFYLHVSFPLPFILYYLNKSLSALHWLYLYFGYKFVLLYHFHYSFAVNLHSFFYSGYASMFFYKCSINY